MPHPARHPADPRDATSAPPVVVHLGPAAPQTGGMVTSITRLCASPLAQRYDVRRLATPYATPGAARGPLARIQRTCRAAGRHLAALWTLYRTLRTNRARLVHIHTCSYRTFYRNLVDLVVARAARCRVVLHIRGGHFAAFYAGAGPLGRLLIRRGCAAADVVVVLSRGWRAALQPLVPAARLVAVPNIAPAPAVFADCSARPADRPCRIVYAAQLSVAKGLDDLLVAARALAAWNVAFELIVAGPAAGPNLEAWRRRATTLGIADRVRFIGPVHGRAHAELLADADLFVHPSHAEGLPNAVLEAAVAGVPIVSTAVGAVPELLTDRSGRAVTPLVPPRDPRALAAALRDLSCNPARRAACARAAHDLVARRCSSTCVAARLARLYDALLGVRIGPPASRIPTGLAQAPAATDHRAPAEPAGVP